MKTTGITMSGNHPKLVQDELKTQTRRTRGLEKINEKPGDWHLAAVFQDGLARFYTDSGNELTLKCPYGGFSDRLWVRETWKIESFMEGEPIMFGYKDGQTKECYDTESPDYEDWEERICLQSSDEASKADIPPDGNGVYHWDVGGSPCRWRPSIHMPRWASRSMLEILEIRAERLQDIKATDALKEGIKLNKPYIYADLKVLADFNDLWDSLNAKRGYGWDFNPWVWVILFRLLDKRLVGV